MSSSRTGIPTTACRFSFANDHHHHHHVCQFQSCGLGTICIQNLANHHIYHCNDDNDDGDDENDSASMMTIVMLFINRGDAVVIFQSVSLLSN